MVQRLLSVLLFSAAFSAGAQISSVQPGNFHNPETWDCSCIPTPTDAIEIAHSIVFTSDLHFSGGIEILPAGSLYGGSNGLFSEDGSVLVNRGSMNMGGIFLSGAAALTNESSGYIYVTGDIISSVNTHIQNAGSFSAESLHHGGPFSNKGSASFDLVHSGHTLVNEADGLLQADSLYNAHQYYNYGYSLLQRLVNASGLVHAAGNMTVMQDAVSDGQFVLEAEGTLTIGHFSNLGTLSVLGSATCEDFLNSGQLGGSGKLCIQDSSVNTGTVSPVYICDQTGSDFDINTGTVDPDVIFCTNGNCAELGVADAALEIALWPNPATGKFTVKTAIPIQSVELYSLTGERITRHASPEVPVEAIAPGTYLVGINGDITVLQRLILR